MTQVPTPRVHNYLSTYCWHDDCPNCRLECKTCQAPCRCRCHVFAQGIEKPSGGPVVATPPIQAAMEPAAASNEARRKALERIAREVVLAKEYTAPINVALDVAAAILAAGWHAPGPEPVGYVVVREENGIRSDPQIFDDFDQANTAQGIADGYEPLGRGWQVYALIDITERGGE